MDETFKDPLHVIYDRKRVFARPSKMFREITPEVVKSLAVTPDVAKRLAWAIIKRTMPYEFRQMCNFGRVGEFPSLDDLRYLDTAYLDYVGRGGMMEVNAIVEGQSNTFSQGANNNEPFRGGYGRGRVFRPSNARAQSTNQGQNNRQQQGRQGNQFSMFRRSKYPEPVFGN